MGHWTHSVYQKGREEVLDRVKQSRSTQGPSKCCLELFEFVANRDSRVLMTAYLHEIPCGVKPARRDEREMVVIHGFTDFIRRVILFYSCHTDTTDSNDLSSIPLVSLVLSHGSLYHFLILILLVPYFNNICFLTFFHLLFPWVYRDIYWEGVGKGRNDCLALLLLKASGLVCCFEFEFCSGW